MAVEQKVVQQNIITKYVANKKHRFYSGVFAYNISFSYNFSVYYICSNKIFILMRPGKNAVCTQTKGLYYKVINKNCGGKIFSYNLRESGRKARTESEKPQHFYMTALI